MLDPATDGLISCNAGHNPLLLFSAEPNDLGRQVQFLPHTSMLLEVTRDSQWHTAQITLHAGDLLHTDGIVEARDTDNNRYPH